MTEEEKTLLINEIVDYLISHSQSVEGIPEATDLDGVSSLPAIKEILNEESQVVRIPLTSILPKFRYANGYVQYKYLNSNWVNLFKVSSSLDWYATKDYVDLNINSLISEAPVTLNTLNKIASALNYDPNFYQNIYQDINAKWTTNNANIAQWDQAYADRHVHDNISSLNLITDILVGKWNEAYSWGDHSQAGYEYDLGNPILSGQILSSDTNGHRSWVDMYQHPVSGVVPNIYTKVTVDINGHVTYGTSLVKEDIPSISWNQVPFDRPNTIEGYGITDAYTKLYIDRYLQRKYSGIVDIDQIIIDGNTISVPSCKANLYDNAGFKGYVSPYDIAAKSFTLTGEEVRYIVISYNGGSPEYIITQERSMINYSNVIPVITVIYDGEKIHSVNWDEQANGLSERLLKRLNRTQRFQRDGGLLINVSGDRSITVSQSTIYFGASEVIYPSSNSLSNLIYSYYHSNGTWTFTKSSYLNNTQYDDGSNLVLLSNANRYAINWVYAGVGDDGDIITLLGSGDYKLDEAVNAQPPINVPDIIKFHGILVGKVIYQNGLNTPYQVISISEQSVSSGGTISEHNNLNGLQGGLAQEFYHLSHSEYLTAKDNNTFTSQAGTYRSVTTDSKGRVVSGTNPTTLSDYGIDDTDVTDSLLTGYTLGLNTEVSASDNILSAFGKLQSYINNRQGTVTSIGLNVPTGFSVGNSPITNSGTISINFATGYSLPSNVNQSNWTSAYDYSLIGHLPLAGGNVTGNIGLVGDLNISGNIYQNGSNYITHTENIYSKNDYIYMREGSSSGLLPGTYSGFEFVNYDGVNNGRLVIDVNGVAKVGDIGEEQPLATREESPLNLGFAYWDSLTNRFKTKTISFSEIIDKPTTLSGYGITDAVTLNTSQDILDTKTFKKSGFGSSINIWSNLDGSNSSISFYNGLSKTLLGYIGISDTGNPSYWDSLLNDYILLHSGNYDDYALSLLGGTLVGVLDVNNSTNSTSTTTGSIKTTGGIGVIGNGYFGGNVTAATFIGALSGNAATATKLQTTRAIAGVSFDGSSDISIPFSNLTSKPTTLSGYGITDAYTKTQTDGFLALKLDSSIFNDLFEKVNTGTEESPVYAIKAKYNFYSVGEVSSFGEGGGSGGSGLIQTVYGYAGLGSTYSDVTLTDTFNAYTINRINIDLSARIASLEAGSAIGFTTVGSGNAVTSVAKSGTNVTVAKGLTFSVDGHTHTFESLTSKPTTLSGYGITDALLASAYNANDVLTKLKTVDGSGSGLDADTVDGIHNGSLTAKVVGGIANYNTPTHRAMTIGEVKTLLKNTLGAEGAMSNAVISSSVVNNWNNESSIGYDSSLHNVIRLDGYGAAPYGQYLFSHYYTNQLLVAGVHNGVWSELKALAFTTDNVASATKLQTARTIWGQSFDGTGDVSGDLTGVGNITVGGYISAGESSDNAYGWINVTRTDSIENASYFSMVKDGNAARGFGINNDNAILIGAPDDNRTIVDTYLSLHEDYVTTTKPFNSSNRIFTGYDSGADYSMSCAGWFRSNGPSGWLNGTYGGGIYQNDSTYVKIYGNKAFKVTSTASYSISTEGGISARGWLKTIGSVGWCSETYGGGIYMTDANYVKVYNSKSFWVDNNIVATGEITAFGTSDIRLKDNVKPINSALDFLSRVKTYEFDWNEKALSLNPLKTKKGAGVIAQELQNLDSDFVHSIYGDYLGVDYERFIPYLIGGVNEVNSKTITLGKRLDDTDSEVYKLKLRISELENKLSYYEHN